MVALSEIQNVNGAFDILNDEGKTPQTLIYDLMETLLTQLEVAMDQHTTTLSVSERKIVEMTIREAREFQEKLIKQEEANKLKRILDALGIIGMIVAVLMTVFAPSPLSVGMLVAAMVMTLEPMIAELTGSASLIQEMMKGLTKAFSELFGDIGGAVATALVMMIILVGVGAAASKLPSGVSAIAPGNFSELGIAVQKVKDMIIDGSQNLLKFLKNPSSATNTGGVLKHGEEVMDTVEDLSPAQARALMAFGDAIQTGIVIAQSGVQIDLALIKKAGAELHKILQITGNEIEFWRDLVGRLEADIKGLLSDRAYALTLST